MRKSKYVKTRNRSWKLEIDVYVIIVERSTCYGHPTHPRGGDSGDEVGFTVAEDSNISKLDDSRDFVKHI